MFVGSINEKMHITSFLDRANDQQFLGSTKLDDIYTFTKFISQNEFWKAQVEHVHITSSGDFEVIPRLGNHRINMGDASNLEEKFKKLMAFYANIGNVAAFLMSDLASGVTGEITYVDGGFSQVVGGIAE